MILGDEYVLTSDRDVVLYDAYGYRYDPERNLQYGHYRHETARRYGAKSKLRWPGSRTGIKLSASSWRAAPVTLHLTCGASNAEPESSPTAVLM